MLSLPYLLFRQLLKLFFVIEECMIKVYDNSYVQTKNEFRESFNSYTTNLINLVIDLTII